MNIVKFYENEEWKHIPIQNFYLYFPSSLNSNITQQFDRTNLRRSVSKFVIRIMEFLGFLIDPNGYKVKILYKTEIDKYKNEIGMVLKFLHSIDMKLLAMLVFLGICKMKMKNILPLWEEFNMPNIALPKGLSFEGNSCYIDSVLFSLFALPSPSNILDSEILNKDLKLISEKQKKWISCGSSKLEDYENRLSIQNELKEITSYMRNNEKYNEQYTCRKFRKLLRNCPTSQKFHSFQEQDAGEFLQYIFNIFEVNITQIKRATLVTNDMSDQPQSYLQTFKKIDYTVPVITVSVFELRNKYRLSNSLFTQEDSQLDYENRYRDTDSGAYFQRRIEINKVISSEFLVFYVQRLNYDGERNMDKIILEDEIEVGTNVLHLYSVIVHERDHYTAFIKIQGEWYHYDDLRDNIRKVENIENIKNYVGKYGTLFFYSGNR